MQLRYISLLASENQWDGVKDVIRADWQSLLGDTSFKVPTALKKMIRLLFKIKILMVTYSSFYHSVLNFLFCGEGCRKTAATTPGFPGHLDPHQSGLVLKVILRLSMGVLLVAGRLVADNQMT